MAMAATKQLQMQLRSQPAEVNGSRDETQQSSSLDSDEKGSKSEGGQLYFICGTSLSGPSPTPADANMRARVNTVTKAAMRGSIARPGHHLSP